ncbi:hypothetical protein DM558_07150 [Entomomonas moraniae]|uniref:TonB-dependent receptor n=1 Tax=Entomomonas moraniae TaxID=2213226 RepID=A0A3Q9JLP4_9GAMM|nr:DUF5339 family protein [Entomomonas moraniae]AZS50567.1 hypothetical protein DM558_07150 [Entomomonas moraniae]
MKKILLGLMIGATSISAMAAELVTECQDYYKEADTMLPQALEAAKSQGMDEAVVKKQYEDSKAQLAALTPEQQKSACTQAKAALVEVKKMQAAQQAAPATEKK